MITKKDLDDAEARGVTTLYAVFPAPKGGGMAQVEYPFVFELGSN